MKQDVRGGKEGGLSAGRWGLAGVERMSGRIPGKANGRAKCLNPRECVAWQEWGRTLGGQDSSF